MLWEIFMNANPNLKQTEPRPFWQRYLVIIGIDSVLVVIGSLLLGDLRQITNLYFYSTIILLVIAAIPILTEVGSSAKIVGKSLKDGEETGTQLKEKKPQYDRGARTTYLFGFAALTTFILAIISLALG
jgi:hypothetical protein